MYTISKEFRFEAAHRLTSLPPEHQCSRPHGHSYRVRVELGSEELTGPGFVADFGELAFFGSYLAAAFDHRDLNTVLSFEPTSERLAKYLAGWFIDAAPPHLDGLLRSVTVMETATSSATYHVVPS
ncbi:6-carboxy-5,6,7,8-tetrahydropterin synthase [Longispora fulva]|uniref:6-carboxy-5,6,7,8-tetrahydropterin synthase n=1 Tax=Longispora fulva TaxID=619741 RepID=A0A8J7GNU1_9ACTN|nr:6-carboxytetrahydropterin synthase [Longispora fulva]MBG6140453.1 6-pyruvoyltetrahydropterin/6-carboxytetrahydropterin synthase [Longispora fulva]GIG57165.1 6-carboxy-5,6,7,8-tetrahydropterin synthase [Longispora fulva]